MEKFAGFCERTFLNREVLISFLYFLSLVGSIGIITYGIYSYCKLPYGSKENLELMIQKNKLTEQIKSLEVENKEILNRLHYANANCDSNK